MADINITLRADERWRDALNRHLPGGILATLENYISGEIDRLPSAERERIGSEIESERASQGKAIRPNTGLRVIREGENRCFLIAQPVSELSMASALRNCLAEGGNRLPDRFRDYYAETREVSPWMFALCIADHDAQSGLEAGMYTVNLDRNEFSIHRPGQGWDVYDTDDVRQAALLADGATMTERAHSFHLLIADELICPPNGAEAFLMGSRELGYGDICFSGELVREGRFAKAWLYNDFAADEILGVLRKGQSVRVSASYDLCHGKLDDTLEVEITRDGCKRDYAYPLSEREAEMVFALMKAHAPLQLEKHRERFLSETRDAIRDVVDAELPVKFQQSVSVRVEPDECIECSSFHEYAAAMQYPDPTRVHIPDSTEKLLTFLVDSGLVTAWQAYELHGEYTFDDDGREAICWPEPEEALEKLGLPELANELRQEQTLQWEPRM